MFKIDSKKNIWLTRGDIATINISAKKSDGSNHTFLVGDIVRFNVFKKNACNDVVLQKDITISEETEIVPISLSTNETRIGEMIHKPVDYWYEVVVNPETAPQTIIGYFDDPTIFKLLPEGGMTFGDEV